VRHLTETVWFYRGQYRIRYSSYLTPKQWSEQSRRFKDERTQWIVDNNGWGKRELRRLGLSVNFENARRAIERGDIKWEIKVLECIGFDADLYERLTELAEG
jgi:hypothetical protein